MAIFLRCFYNVFVKWYTFFYFSLFRIFFKNHLTATTWSLNTFFPILHFLCSWIYELYVKQFYLWFYKKLSRRISYQKVCILLKKNPVRKSIILKNIFDEFSWNRFDFLVLLFVIFNKANQRFGKQIFKKETLQWRHL